MTVTKLLGQIDIVFSVQGTVDRARLNVIKERIERYASDLNDAVTEKIDGFIDIGEPSVTLEYLIRVSQTTDEGE